MNIQLFNERVSLESRMLQLFVRQRQWLIEERLTKLEQLIRRQQPSSARQLRKGRNLSTIPTANTGDQRLESITI